MIEIFSIAMHLSRNRMNSMRKHIVNNRDFPNAFVQKHDEKALIKSHK